MDTLYLVIGEILLPFSLGLLCVWYVHPWMVRIAELKDIVDEPSSRRAGSFSGVLFQFWAEFAYFWVRL